MGIFHHRHKYDLTIKDDIWDLLREVTPPVLEVCCDSTSAPILLYNSQTFVQQDLQFVVRLPFLIECQYSFCILFSTKSVTLKGCKYRSYGVGGLTTETTRDLQNS